MKLFTKILAVATVCVLAVLPARAQMGFDTFKAVAFLPIAPMQNFTVNGGVGVITNGPFDMSLVSANGANGWGSVIFNGQTNSGSTTLTAQLFQSNDQTNWFVLTNALTTSATYIITNYQYGAAGTNLNNGTAYNGLWATNTYITAYSSNSATAWIAGYATPYPSFQPVTNTTITLTGSKTLVVGFPWATVYKYLEVIYTTGGAVTNAEESATLIGPFVRNPY